MTTAEIIDSAKGATMGSMSLADKQDMVEALIKRLYALKGLDVDLDRDRIELATGELEGVLSRKYPHFTTGEVKMVLEAGASGEFGNDTRLVPATMIGWLSKYSALPERAAAVKELEKRRKAANAQTTNLLPPADRAALSREFEGSGPMTEWQRFKEEGSGYRISFAGYGDAIYRALVARGRMTKISEATWAAAAANARRDYARQHSGEGQTAVQEAMANIDKRCTFQAYVHRELVYAYFKALKAAGRELDV